MNARREVDFFFGVLQIWLSGAPTCFVWQADKNPAQETKNPKTQGPKGPDFQNHPLGDSSLLPISYQSSPSISTVDFVIRLLSDH